MKIEYFEYFITLAQSSSISKAADKLFISKQQLTRIIDAIEAELNVTLLEKSPNGISLTEDGEEFLKYATEFVSSYTAMKNNFALRQKTSEQYTTSATVKLILAPCLAMLASDIVKSLKRIAPNIKPIIRDKSSNLNEGIFDEAAICFWALATQPEELLLNDGRLLTAELLGHTDSYLVYNKQFRQINITDNRINTLANTQFSHAYNLSENKEDIVLISSNIYQVLDSIAEGDNLCSVADFVLPKIHVSYPHLDFISLNASSPIYVIHSNTYTLTEADEVVVNFMRSYIQNLQLLAKQIV